ncbi:MAG: HAD hydrolase-like protein [Burkholderiaceae bacterium]|nr:HAD hydrolase-like protein [Burkholderiaceae bacterium]
MPERGAESRVVVDQQDADLGRGRRGGVRHGVVSVIVNCRLAAWPAGMPVSPAMTCSMAARRASGASGLYRIGMPCSLMPRIRFGSVSPVIKSAGKRGPKAARAAAITSKPLWPAARRKSDTTMAGAVMVGDGINDVLAAKDAGIPCVAVAFGYGEAETLGADRVIQRMEELPEVAALLR